MLLEFNLKDIWISFLVTFPRKFLFFESVPHFFFTILILIATNCYSQIVARLYYNDKWLLTEKDSVHFFRVSVFDTTNRVFAGEVRDFTRDGKLVMKGSYKNGRPHGEFTFYFRNGKPECIGNFDGGLRIGFWKYFYPNGIARSEVEFSMDKVTAIPFFNDSLGVKILTNGTGQWREEYDSPGFTQRVVNQGRLKNLGKEGEWTCQLTDGTVLFTEKYSAGQFVWGKASKLISEKVNYSAPVENSMLIHYKFDRTETFQLSPGNTFKSYPFLILKPRVRPTDTTNERFSKVDESAHPEGGLSTFYLTIGETLRYPSEAKNKGIQGKVFVEFVVNEDGRLTDFAVIKGIGAGCDAEAIRCISESQKRCKWTPAKYQGKPVKQRYTLPLIFKL
jgi:TonB family protein